MQSFTGAGGQVWVCGSCARPRGITEAGLIAGAQIVTAAHVAQCLASGAASSGF